jgi:hypothetical protein
MHDRNHPGHCKLLSNRFLLVEWQECTRELQWPIRSQCFGYNILLFWPCTMICGKLIVLKWSWDYPVWIKNGQKKWHRFRDGKRYLKLTLSYRQMNGGLTWLASI